MEDETVDKWQFWASLQAIEVIGIGTKRQGIHETVDLASDFDYPIEINLTDPNQGQVQDSGAVVFQVKNLAIPTRVQASVLLDPYQTAGGVTVEFAVWE